MNLESSLSYLEKINENRYNDMDEERCECGSLSIVKTIFVGRKIFKIISCSNIECSKNKNKKFKKVI